MNTLIIYESFFGNTKEIAQAIADGFGPDGRLLEVGAVKPDDLTNAKLVIIGSPIRGWQPTEKTMALLNSLAPARLAGVKAATFDTRIKVFFSGNGAKVIAKKLKSAGAEIMAAPTGFYVKGKVGPLLDGEVDKAKTWGAFLKNRAG